MGGWRPTPSSRPAPSRSATPTSPPSARSTSSPRSSRAWPASGPRSTRSPPTPRRRRSRTRSSPWSVPATCCAASPPCSSCSPRRPAPRASGRSRPRWRHCSPRTPTRSGSTPRCSRASRRSRRNGGWVASRRLRRLEMARQVGTARWSRTARRMGRARRVGAAPRTPRTGGSSSATTATPCGPGARLGPAEQERLRAINAELSSLTTEFGNRLLAGAAAAAVHVTDPSQLDGLTPDALSAAARAARSRGLDGHLLTLVLPTEQPALAALTHRDLRERLHTASVTRGLGGEHDTRATLLKIVTLRAERARLLGHPHHASWVVETATAASTEAVDAMLHRLAPIAAANARAEADDARRCRGPPHRPVGLRLLRRAGAPRALRRRRGRPAPLLRAGARAARRRLPRRATGSTASASPSATTSRPTTPTSASSRSPTPTAPARPVPRRPLRPRHASAAAPG